MRSIPLRFRLECLWNILFKKCGISNQPVAASAMIRVFPSLEHSGGACPHSARQFVGLLCSTYLCSRKKHNRAKPMSELLSALISIADSSEFRFARFNIVYEGAQLVLPESPPIVSGVSDMRPPGVQTWKRHGIRCKICLEEIHTFFSTEWFRLIFIPEPVSAFTSI